MRMLSIPGHAVALLGLSVSPAFAQSPEAMNKWYESIRSNNITVMRGLIKSGGVNARDDRGSTPLTWAAAFGSPESVELLLAAGADTNVQNSFGVTPLMLAVTEPRKAKALINHGADVNAKSKVGHTALLIACLTDGTSPLVRLLLDKGASATARDEAAKTTPLIAATRANDTQTIEMLLARGAGVNDSSVSGRTPLMNAAFNGNLKVIRELLARGADVNAVSGRPHGNQVKNGTISIGLLTPLMLAASTGGHEAVRLLLDAGAKVNVQDVRGMTALTFATATDHADPNTVADLIAHGANVSLADNQDMTPAGWAKSYAIPAVLKEFAITASTVAPGQMELAGDARPSIREAVAGSADLLQNNAQSFLKEGGCASCHSHELSNIAVKAAADSGIAINAKLHEEQRRSTELKFKSGEYMLMQRMDPPVVSILTFGLQDMATENVPASQTIDALIHNVAAQQRQDGSWMEPGPTRAPMEDGQFIHTAQAILAMQTYAWKGRRADLKVRVERAAAWLQKQHPVTTQDHVMQTMGLMWAHAMGATKQERIHDLLSLQKPDGGWSQTPWLGTDAYATGQVLCALYDLGQEVTSPVYRRGVDFLLRTRQADGSWHVKSRAMRFQPYFESGFPYGPDQWISSAGTAVATTALAHAIQTEKPKLTASR
jgi:ankyrin repeat protein